MTKSQIDFLSNFCVFIISHGRAENQITLRTLERSGYTGPCFIVIDNEDSQKDKYVVLYGIEKVVVFDKKHYAKLVDNCDNFNNRRTTTHARNACFDIAKQKGKEWFLVLDDDYTAFSYAIVKNGQEKRNVIKMKIDSFFHAAIEFLETDERIASVCYMQGGDIIGGLIGSRIFDTFPFYKRKAMNSFFCKTSRRFWFFSRLNEDVNTYLLAGAKGTFFFTLPILQLNQKQTQKNAGGMTDAYLASGTYVKSFYTVMIVPSCCKVEYAASMSRLHHRINWNNAVPRILDEAHKKTAKKLVDKSPPKR
jgi:hypothetical protein